MDNNTIERLAANAVEDALHELGIIQAEISKNDKTPSWDGFIIVYNSSSKEKSAIDGKVDVQVKGKLDDDHTPKTISYPAEVADLRNYLHNGGAIYFVVRINKNDIAQRKIYYETLTPVKLKNYLDGVEKQKNKTIKLKEFPSGRNKRMTIIVNFLKHSRKQESHEETGFIPLDELKKNESKYIPHIEMVGYGSGDNNDLFSALFENEVYMYVSMEGSPALIPVDTPLTISDITETIEKKISVGDKVYYDYFQRVRSAEGVSIKFGDSTTFIFEKSAEKTDSVTIKSNISFSSYLRKRAKDIEFTIALANGGRLCIGGNQLGILAMNEAPQDFIPIMQKRLAHYTKIIQMLDTLHVEEDLDMSDLDDEQKNALEILVAVFVERKNILHTLNKADTSILDLKLPNLTIRLLIENRDDGTRVVHDFFNTSIWSFSLRFENNERQIVPPYSALSKDDYLKISNIDYEKMLSSYQALSSVGSKIFCVANNDLLKMLMAYDEKPNAKLLNAAKGIAYWILTDNRNNDVDKNITILNYLQIIKRERTLEKNETAQLYTITESINSSEQEKIGAYLLLDTQSAAEIHWEQLTDEEKDTFKGFPIYKFWVPSIDKTQL